MPSVFLFDERWYCTLEIFTLNAYHKLIKKKRLAYKIFTLRVNQAELLCISIFANTKFKYCPTTSLECSKTKLDVAKFMYSLHHRNLPNAVRSSFVIITEIHNYDTRTKQSDIL